MCGIFGIIVSEDFNLSSQKLMNIVNQMFKLSESRGKEASGLAVRVNQAIYVFKEPVSSSKLIKSKQYKELFTNTLKTEWCAKDCLKSPLVVLGHSRLQTNGHSECNSNNQPVIKDGAVGIHNGIIVNDQEVWASIPELEKNFDVDTEVFLGLLQMLRKRDKSLVAAVQSVFGSIEGSASVAVLFDDINTLMLATNTGSLYIAPSIDGKMLIFASEKYILGKVVNAATMANLFGSGAITKVEAGNGYLIDLKTLEKHLFNLKPHEIDDKFELNAVPRINIVELHDQKLTMDSCCKTQPQLGEDLKASMMQNWETLYSDVDNLKRCSKCLLPETMPFIDFDEGVCNYCRDYETRGSFLKGEQALEEEVSKYRNVSGEADCIVGFSGGRDSVYGLDYIINHLKMHPITFTYDWGMVNDLARRNQARVVGNLGVEQIVVSADIKRKRDNIRKNLKAWLKKPDLGMVPILMAGDKQFYYYFHKVRKQTGVKLFVFCGGYEGEEGTGLFKYGFCNVNQGHKKALSRLTGISRVNKLKIMSYYAGQFLRNPAYINRSMVDTLFAYYSTYVLTDDYLYLYHYIDWDEQKILSTITDKFNWEKETDTTTTWRIDDGTAAFYNYIYMTMAGFTEFEIFRSHQIREGKMTRAQAFELIKEENKPRFKSIEWYGQAINFDMNKAIEIINSAPRLYEKFAEKKESQQNVATSSAEYRMPDEYLTTALANPNKSGPKL